MSFINFIDFCAIKIHDFLDDRHERKIDLMQKKRHCDNCDRLVHLLELSEARQVKLLEKIGSVEAKAPQPTEIPKPLGNDYLPWSVRRAKLESESAKLARELKEFELSKKPENHQLELELESDDL
jgi:hypothetical protein